MYHNLNINLSLRSIRQKRRLMDVTRYEALKEEVDRLLEISFI